jgi:hypothetical protein
MAVMAIFGRENLEAKGLFSILLSKSCIKQKWQLVVGV